MATVSGRLTSTSCFCCQDDHLHARYRREGRKCDRPKTSTKKRGARGHFILTSLYDWIFLGREVALPDIVPCHQTGTTAQLKPNLVVLDIVVAVFFFSHTILLFSHEPISHPFPLLSTSQREHLTRGKRKKLLTGDRRQCDVSF